MFEMNETVLWLLGLLVSFVVFWANYRQRKTGEKFSQKTMAWMLYGISFVVVLFFGHSELPALPAFVNISSASPELFMSAFLQNIGFAIFYAGDLLATLTAVVAAAWVPYQYLYKQVFEKLYRPLPDAK